MYEIKIYNGERQRP